MCLLPPPLFQLTVLQLIMLSIFIQLLLALIDKQDHFIGFTQLERYFIAEISMQHIVHLSLTGPFGQFSEEIASSEKQCAELFWYLVESN